MGKQYWEGTLPRVLEQQESGYTHRMIGGELGCLIFSVPFSEANPLL